MCIYGPPLAGKTTLASALARTLRVPHINTDDIAGSLPQGGDTSDLGMATSFAAARDAAVAVARRQLDNGISAVVDAALPDELNWKRFRRICDEIGASFHAIELRIPLAVAEARRRRANRPGQALQHTEQSLAAVYGSLAHRYAGRNPDVVINGDIPLKDTVRQVALSLRRSAR